MTRKPIGLRKQTLRILTVHELDGAHGGYPTNDPSTLSDCTNCSDCCQDDTMFGANDAGRGSDFASIQDGWGSDYG